MGIKATARQKGDNTIIYIPAENIPLVRELVKPYMHPCFYYKLGIN
jgi:hypothetical protein